MFEKEGLELIGRRAAELAAMPEVQKKAVEIAKKDGKEAAEKYIYMLAIATLCGA